MFYYFDSMSSSASRVLPSLAKKFAGKLHPIVERWHRCSQRKEGEEAGAQAHKTKASASDAPSTRSNKNVTLLAPPCCPQQTNGSDCGVYVLAVAEVIAAARGSHADAPIDGAQVAAALKTVTPKEVTKKRGEILAVIKQLAERQ